jgi:L-aspartate oxidase
VHGANRLASNSLLEGLVFGARAGEAMAADHNPAPPWEDEPASPSALSAPSPYSAEFRSRIQEFCWETLGLEREAAGLAALTRWLEQARAESGTAPADRASAEVRNLAEVAWAMARSAAFRQESRGAHFRTDFPQPDDGRFRGHTLLERGGVRLADVEEPLAVSA